MFYDTVYQALFAFSDYRIGGYLLCRLIAPVVLIIILWISRVMASPLMKLFACAIAVILYYFPSIITAFQVH